MLSNAQFELMTTLQYANIDLKRRVKEFENGDKYISMAEGYKKQLADKDRIIKGLELKLAEANRAVIINRENWMQVFSDLEKEHRKALAVKDRWCKFYQECSLTNERRYEELHGKYRAALSELYAVKAELEDGKEKAARLAAQLKLNHENSSMPSSQKPNRKKIPNSRVKTGKQPGGQPGHKGHRRKWQIPMNVIDIPPPAEFLDNPRYYPTGRVIAKQFVNVEVRVVTDEFRTPEFRDRITRLLVYADFPDGVVDDVNYGASVKAFAFLLNNHCNVSIDKTRELLLELTGGALEISKGMINGLSREFSMKTKREQANVLTSLLCAPVMGADFTTARVNGKLRQVLVCAAGGDVMYYAREHKGHEGVKGTPVEYCQNTLVHDHDRTFYSYGRRHQECLAHILRYLIASIEYETNLTWSKQMWELVREMIHYRNSLGDDEDIDGNVVADFECRYVQILETAKNEYEFEPPGKYYKDGYNLYLRMLEYIDSHLLFLHDKNVPTNNSLCERLLRVLKMKLRQVMSLRSDESLEYLCATLGVLAQIKSRGESLYNGVAAIFKQLD